MAKRSAQDWEDLEHDLHAAEVSPDEIEAGAHASGPGARPPGRRGAQAAQPHATGHSRNDGS
jgi:hypothetical protein